MKLVVDARLADRRHQVRESWARRRLRWVVGCAGVVLVAAVGLAVLESPWLAVRAIEIEGARNAPVEQLLTEAGVVPGYPTIRVRPPALVTMLETDPWVADAAVSVSWPGGVEVTVVERTPAAWVDTGKRWALVAVDGVVLTMGRPGAGEPRLLGTYAGIRPGNHIGNETAAAVLGFMGRLPAELAAGAAGHTTKQGGVVITGKLTILIGDSSDLDAKAAALAALLAQGVRGESTINLISPTRPGVVNTRPVVETLPVDAPRSSASS